MTNKLTLQITTPASIIYADSKVNEILAPTQKGQIGVLPNHKPMIIALVCGIINIITQNNEASFFIGKGLMHITQNTCNIMGNQITSIKEIEAEEIHAIITTKQKFIDAINANEPNLENNKEIEILTNAILAYKQLIKIKSNK